MTRGQGRDRSLVEAKEFHVAKENCSVTIGFHGVVLRQGILCRDRVSAKTKGSLFTKEYFYVAAELARPRVLCLDIMFLCCNRVGNGREALCHDRIVCVSTECGQRERFCVATKKFYVAT